MKVDLLTFCDSYNHGAGLQAYASYVFLTKMGAEVELLNYRNAEEEKSYNPFGRKKNSSFKAHIKKILKNSIYGGKKNGERGFREFNKMLPRTKQYTKDTLQNFDTENDCDFVVIGSDQVWNPGICGGIFDYAFFGDFTGKKKFSLASSCGSYQFKPDELKKIVPLLEQFSSVSVREQFLKDQLVNGGVRQEIKCIADPTLLLSRDTWQSQIDQYAKSPLPKEKYMAIYLIALKYEDYLPYFRYISQKYGCKIALITKFTMKKPDVDYYLTDISPFDFANVIANAEFVCTDSFHGTVFSLIFGRKFISMKNKNYRRIENLLNENQLSERFVSTFDEMKQAVEMPIDDTAVAGRLAQYRNQAEEFVKDVFSKP